MRAGRPTPSTLPTAGLLAAAVLVALAGVHLATASAGDGSARTAARPAGQPTAPATASPTGQPSASPSATAEPTVTPSASPTAICTPPPPSLALSLVPDQVRVGELVGLRISYHNIGLPYTTVYSSPEGLVTPDPPLAMPCRYGEHPARCQEITYRALAAGTVTFRASATGEIRVCSNGLPAWTWGGASEQQAVQLQIAAAGRAIVPVALRDAALDAP